MTERGAAGGQRAAPASPVVSVIVPVHQGAAVLPQCLAGLEASDLPRERWELILVDDASTDAAVSGCAARADRICRIADGPRGPAHARNVGADAARAPLLCFVDADVVVAPHTLRGLVARLEADPDLVAAFGAYDTQPAARGLVSQYRNLLHHHVHRAHAGEAETFWAGCGIVRRDAFRAARGFDADRFPRPQVEDIDLGYRLRDAGGRILLDPALTGTHLKRWTLAGMLRTDLVDRAVPWSRLLLSRGATLGHAPLNLSLHHKALTACAGVALLSAPLALLARSSSLALVAAVAIAALVVGNAALFAWFARVRGWGFALGTVPLQCLHHTMAALGALWALVTRPADPHSATRWSPAAIAAAALLLALHAWLAWSVRIPSITTGGDDAVLLTLARALREGSYRDLWIVGSPVHAMYPPGYPALLALLGATGVDTLPRAVAANIVASTLALALAAKLAGRIAPWLGVALLLACAPNPALVDLAGRVMSEPTFMLFAFGALVALPHRRATAAACAIAAALVRSIGLAVVVALFVHWLLEGRRRAAWGLAIASTFTVGMWLVWTVRAPRLDAGSSYVADVLLVAPAATAAAEAPAPPTFAAVLLDRVRRNIPDYLTRAVPSALSQPTRSGTVVDNMLGLAALLALAALGTAWLATRQRALLLLLGAYGGVLAVWPYQLTRFVVPLLPALVLVLLTGAWQLAERRGQPSRRAGRGILMAGSVAGLLALFTLPPNLQRHREVAACERGPDARRSIGCVSERQRDFFAAVDAVDEVAAGTPATSPILTSKSATVFALSGRVSVRQADALRHQDPDAFVEWLRAQRVEYLLLTHVHLQQWALSPMLTARCRAFTVLRRFPSRAVVVRLAPPEEPASDAAADEACSAIASWAGIDWQTEVERSDRGPW